MGLATVMALIASWPLLARSESVIEKQIKERPEPFQNFYFASYYEYGSVTLGERRGLWRTFTNDLGYKLNNFLTTYLEGVALNRFSEKDYTLAAGGYWKFGTVANARLEAGWGLNKSYVYKWQIGGEYEQKIINRWFGAIGYRYLDYDSWKVSLLSPRLTYYYFGDNFLSVQYNLAHTGGRGAAQSAVLKTNFALNDNIHLWIGTAMGERLYDIYQLSVAEQKGYIIFTGLDFKISGRLHVKVGSSYSKERPNFVNRSFDSGFVVKF